MAYADVILAEASLQSYWRLGETAGSGTVADSKGSETGTVTAADVTLGVAGLLTGDADTCAQVDSATVPGAINFGDIYPFAGTANFSVELWIKPSAASLAANGYIVYNATATDGWGFRVLAAGAIRFIRTGTSVTDQCQSANGVIVADTVYHCVATYDGATILIYVNGAQVATLGSTLSMGDPVQTLTVGEATGGGNVAIGYYDEVAIYNDDLSAAKVQEHYDAGLGNFPATSEPGYWRLVGPAQLGTSAADLYTVPAGMTAEIRQLYVNNPSGSEIEFTVSVGNDATGTRLLDQHAVAANDSYGTRRKFNHTLQPGEKIQGFADAATTVIVIDGYLRAL